MYCENEWEEGSGVCEQGSRGEVCYPNTVTSNWITVDGDVTIGLDE